MPALLYSTQWQKLGGGKWQKRVDGPGRYSRARQNSFEEGNCVVENECVCMVVVRGCVCWGIDIDLETSRDSG